MGKGLAIVVATLVCFCTLVTVIRADTVRTRLTERTGVIAEPASGSGKYADSRSSLWFIEGNSTLGYVKLKFNYLDLECSWDYLHIFGSDSVHDDKLAAYSGDVLPPTNEPQQGRPTATPLDGHLSSLTDNNGGSITSGSGSGDMSDLLPTREIFLSSSTPRLLLHFYSDASANARGFNISYWVSSCIANCSDNGDCDEETGVCDCYTGWTGDYCQHVGCPSACSAHGVCDNQQKLCVCDNGFTGEDCSIPRNTDHWQRVNVSSSLGIEDMERAGHSAVVWDEWMWVYGGYQFPTVSSSSQDGSVDDSTLTQMIRYHFESETWEAVPSDDSVQPSPRYGHSAVVYNDTMVVFGGSLLLSEKVTNELWVFNFSNVSWTQIPTEANLNENSTTNSSSFLPIGVRDHTANIVGDKMIVLFGYSQLRDIILTYVQEYNFVDETWSAPLSSFNSFIDFPTGRMGHTSSYIAETGLIYVHGGYNAGGFVRALLTYHPSSRVWSEWTRSPLPQTFHSTTILGSLLVSFGGKTNGSCIGNNTVIYNIVCNSWQIVDFPGLSLNSSRIGHTTVGAPTGGGLIMFGGFLGQLHHDTVHLVPGNCSRLSAAQCTGNASPFCGWSNSSSQCVPLHSQYHLDNSICPIPDHCRMLFTCASCLSSTLNCVWNISTSHCLSSSLAGPLTNSTHITSNSSVCATTLHNQTCSSYHSCNSCAVHNECLWNNVLVACVEADKLQTNNTAPVSPPGICPVSGCFQHTSCGSCTTINSCLWCSSLSVCVPNSSLYPYVFPFGQCLGWSSRSCPADDCSGYKSCDSCEVDVRCGWCQGPANTGLGVCREGGFLASQNTSACPASRWFFDECPACQCNGHSVCVNESICVDCQNNTKGTNCEQCVDTFYGDPRNGQFCSVCDCNGYNTTCNSTNGNCVCSNVGVSGPRCGQCFTQQGFGGDASNICYYTLQVGYIYSQLTTGNGQEAFYLTRPSGDAGLTFKFEITFNPELNPIWVQLYLGRASERYQVLVNLTEPRMVERTNSFDMLIGSFSSPNDTELFTFAHEDIMNTSNFTELFYNAVADDYTANLWDGDVALIIRVFNVSSHVVYKITVDQSNLMFLLYFFVTFVSCFTFLLSAFLIGWYIKRKLEIRAFIRAQHIEMQRRVRRPFARIKTIVGKRLEPRMRQQASYVAVETCKDTKAAVLTLLVRLPGNQETGHPSSGRTGVCFGSTIVKMNASKIKNKKNKESSSATRRRNHTEVHIDT